MQDDAIRELMQHRPFQLIELGLSDGRSVLIRHLDQAVVTRRKVFVGLAQIRGRRKRLSTPAKAETIAKDWILLDLVHIVSVEPSNGNTSRRARDGKRPREK